MEEEEKGRKGGRETDINKGENVGADLYETKKRKEEKEKQKKLRLDDCWPRLRK